MQKKSDRERGAYVEIDKKRASVKKIKRGDEDVRPAGGGAALYLFCGNLEMFNWPSHCPHFFDWSIYSFPVSSCHFYRSWQRYAEIRK